MLYTRANKTCCSLFTRARKATKELVKENLPGFHSVLFRRLIIISSILNVHHNLYHQGMTALEILHPLLQSLVKEWKGLVSI